MAQTGPKNIDWQQAKQDYLADAGMTYAKIAKKYGLTKGTVEQRAKKENWVKTRQELGKKAEQAFHEKLLTEKSQVQSAHLLAFQNLRAVANKIIYDMANSNYEHYKGQLVFGKDGKPIPVIPDAFQLEKAARSLKIAAEMERLALGLPSNVSGLTDGKGDPVMGGFLDSIKPAKKVLEENGITIRVERSKPSDSNTS